MNSFYPSRRAVTAVALGIPLSLLAALASPGLWAVGVFWGSGVLLLTVLDMVLAARTGQLQVTRHVPALVGIGRDAAAELSLAFSGSSPRAVEVELEGNDRLDITPVRQSLALAERQATAAFTIRPLRRGAGRLDQLWLRWLGPLGLAWTQRTETLNHALPVIPDIQSVSEEAIRLFQRDTDSGLHMRLNRGDGSEFHALRDYQAGHDPRQIDWKQSARHNALIVREFRMEQNQHIVAVLDTGRLMSEPLAGQPRLDRALHAILLLLYVGLKLGDRAGLCAFDSHRRLNSGVVAGVRAFPALQRLAATLDYSDAETNFTLGLTQLSGDLAHRSVIFMFTDFSDTTSAELMLENIARLLKRHSVIFVVFRDEELEAMRQGPPDSARDATRAVIAEMLHRERELVMRKLRQMGVEIIDTPVDQIGAGVINAYLAHKQRNRL